MKENEKRSTEFLIATDELRKLILENPELPLLVFAGEECGGEYNYMICTRITAKIGEFLDCRQDVNDEYCFTDREMLEEQIEIQSDFNGTNEEFAAYIDARMKEYEPYWKPCIIVYIDN